MAQKLTKQSSSLDEWNKQVAKTIEQKILGLPLEKVKSRMMKQGLDQNMLDDYNNEKDKKYRVFFKMLQPKVNNLRSIVKGWPQKLQRMVHAWTTFVDSVGVEYTEKPSTRMEVQLRQDASLLMPRWLKSELKIEATESRKRAKHGCSSSGSFSCADETPDKMFKKLERWVSSNMDAEERQKMLAKTLSVGTNVQVTPKTLRRLFPNLYEMMPLEGVVAGVKNDEYCIRFELSENVDERHQTDVNYNEEDAFDQEVVTFDLKDGASINCTSAAKSTQFRQVNVPKEEVYTYDEKVGAKAQTKALEEGLLPYFVRYIRVFSHLMHILADREVISSICDELQGHYEGMQYDSDYYTSEAQAKADRWEGNRESALQWEQDYCKNIDTSSSFVQLMRQLEDNYIAIEVELGDN